MLPNNGVTFRVEGDRTYGFAVTHMASPACRIALPCLGIQDMACSKNGMIFAGMTLLR